MMKMSFNVDTRRAKYLEDNAAKYARVPCNKAAQALLDDIDQSWSPVSPGPAGGPPGKQSTNLAGSLSRDASGRDILGRFADADSAAAVFVRVDTTTGPYYHGRGAYEMAQEFGSSNTQTGGWNEARPFFNPAIDRVSAIFPQFFVRMFDSDFAGSEDE